LAASSQRSQGSPLSLLLYVFYNADLVEWKIDRAGGALGFIDDFNAWVVGDNATQNTKTIQDIIIPYAEYRDGLYGYRE
jgi:hypothetical protein